ncbi:MAG: formylglycine-generating enzyme family protein, partial [Planctomycetales bacterium]|nr:formylglycine-generating enzyme family protein [Planctomycetales bacterium]
VETVSWEDAQEFLQRLAQAEPGTNYRLPTEAEWEYACRAGTTTPYWFGSALNGEQANCDGNCPHGTESKGPPLMRPVEVGRYGANPLGLFDQHGNVWEWCQDWYEAKYYRQFANKTAVDPTGRASGSSVVCRGGAWRSSAISCRSANRNYYGRSYRDSGIGFRVVLS